MAKYFTNCQDLLKNSTIPQECPTSGISETTVCCVRDCCFLTRKKNDFWQNWYFWFAILFFGLLALFSFISYLSGFCKRKHHNLIRVRHLSAGLNDDRSTITVISGPDGIIQPSINYNKRSKVTSLNKTFNNDRNGRHGVNPSIETIMEVPKEVEDCQITKNLARPLSPPYTPIKPVTIIRGSAPPLGYRTTSSYTELVLPPGYIQSGSDNVNKG